MALKIFVTRFFDKQARRVDLTDRALVEAVMRAERGLVDAKVGRLLIKQRVPRPGQGRSGGFRTIIAYWKGDLAVFVFVFAKSAQPNLSDRALTSMEALAETFEGLSAAEVRELVKEGEWRPVHVVH